MWLSILLASALIAPNSGVYVIKFGDKEIGREQFEVRGLTLHSHVELSIKGKSVVMDVDYETRRMGLHRYVLEADVNGSHQKVLCELNGSFLREEVYVDSEKKLEKSYKVEPPVLVLDNNVPSQLALLVRALPDSDRFKVFVPQIANFVNVKVIERGKGEIVDSSGRVIVTDRVTIAPGGYVRYDIYYRGDTMFLASALKGGMVLSLNGMYALKPEFKADYRVKKFAVRVEGGKVRGEFDLPRAEPKGVIMLIAGSGDVDRHEIGVFDDLTKCLTDSGFIVARYDKPGTGKSFKPKEPVDFRLLIEAADSVLNEASRRFPELPLFVLGHSEGGEIALAIGKNPRVNGLILLAAPASPLDTLLVGQIRRLLEASGATDSTETDSIISVLSSKLDSLRNAPVAEGYVQLPIMGEAPAAWLKQQMEFSPINAAREITVPVLLVYGGADLQVPVEEMKKLKAVLKARVSVATKVMPGNTHFFEDRRGLCENITGWLSRQVNR